MIDSLQQDTMVNMSWPEIKEYVERDALVLMPLGVIEEHGPHLCLGTDIYIAHVESLIVRDKLNARGYEVIIAPPFNWGVCQATGSFCGSFKIKKETAKALLYDIISSLAEFGFRRIYGVNAHGDIEHNIAIIEAFCTASQDLGITASYAFSKEVMHHYGLNGEEKHICPIEASTTTHSRAAAPDVHGGDVETAIMHKFYPLITNTTRAKGLSPTKLSNDKIMTWLFGGHTEELSPQGYLGSPADYEGVDVNAYLDDVTSRIAEAILTHVNR